MTRRSLSLSREERAASLDAKQSRFLENLARELDALGSAPSAPKPPPANVFYRRKGRPLLPRRTATKDHQGE